MKNSLHIGINNYPGTGMDLSGCVNDANDWQNTLKDKGFKTKIILDSECTKANVIDAIQELIDNTGPDDIGVITYSGHGTWVPDVSGDESDGRDEALALYDVKTAGPLLDDTLVEIFRTRGYSARIIFISDSCHSGTVSRSVNFLDEEGSDTSIPRYMPPEVFLDDDMLFHAKKVENIKPICPPESPALLMSGCKDTEYSYDARFKGKPNGAFTYVALKELKELSADDTYQIWFQKIKKTLPHQRYPQTPQLQATKSQKNWKIFQD